MDPHRLAEERSIEMHAAIARRLRSTPSILERARARVERWRRSGEVHSTYADAWAAFLSKPVDVLCAWLVDPSEEARAMRQCSPFAGALDAQTRWAIWREVRARVDP
jgi:hypothetical protein